MKALWDGGLAFALSQKARGLAYVDPRYMLPTLVLSGDGAVPMSDVEEWLRTQAAGDSVFVRPCPRVPRPGHYDSVRVETADLPAVSRVVEQVRDTMLQDEGFCEMLLQPFVPAEASAVVVVPSRRRAGVRAELGFGHDAVTAGRDVLYEDSGVEMPLFVKVMPPVAHEVEVVWSEVHHYVVQVRAFRGKATHSDVVVPQPGFKVREVREYPHLTVEEAERLSRELPAGTYVRTKLPLLSHQAAVLVQAGAAVGRRLVQVGDVLRVADVQERDESAFWRGVDAALSQPLAESAAPCVFSRAFHSFIVKGWNPLLAGFHVGEVLRRVAVACIVETRYEAKFRLRAPLASVNDWRYSVRTAGYEYFLSRGTSLSELRDMLAASYVRFRHGVWRSQYGGPSWCWAALYGIELLEAVQQRELDTVLNKANRVENLYHNTGRLLSKWAVRWLDVGTANRVAFPVWGQHMREVASAVRTYRLTEETEEAKDVEL